MKMLIGKSNFVHTVEDRIEYVKLTAIVNSIAPRVEQAVKWMNTSSAQESTTVLTSSKCGERKGIAASFENTTEKKDTLIVLNTIYETRKN